MKNNIPMSVIVFMILITACSPATDSKNTTQESEGSAHNGSEASPTILTLGTAFSGKIGSYSNVSDSESYYRFNSGSNTSVMLSITSSSVAHPSTTDNEDYWLHLYGSGGFSSTAIKSPNVIDGVSPIFENLTVNTDYHVRVLNRVSAATTYRIKVEAAPTTGLNEGSIGSPIVLTLGTAYTTAKTTNQSSGKSYYKFNTGTKTSVSITYGKDLLDSELYQASTFTTRLGEDWSSTAHSFTVSGLTAGIDYYLMMENGSSFDTAKVDFTLTVTGL